MHNIDGRQDTTVVLIIGKNGKTFMKTTLEHYVTVGEPEGFYLDHFSPPNGKGQILALHMHSAIKDTELELKFAFIGSDGTPSMKEHTNKLIAALERLLKRPLQWVICLLHCMKLSLCHVFTALDGSTTNADSFGVPIGKKVGEPESTWPTEEFNPVLLDSTNLSCFKFLYFFLIDLINKFDTTHILSF